jgi:hypothetical protein
MQDIVEKERIPKRAIYVDLYNIVIFIIQQCLKLKGENPCSYLQMIIPLKYNLLRNTNLQQTAKSINFHEFYLENLQHKSATRKSESDYQSCVNNTGKSFIMM